MVLGWGNDFIRATDRDGHEAWTNELAKRHQRASHVKDPYRLRVNAYRVLLTRGRKGRGSRAFARGAGGAPRHAAVIFVPPDPLFDATAAWLQGHGAKVQGQLPRRPPPRPGDPPPIRIRQLIR